MEFLHGLLNHWGCRGCQKKQKDKEIFLQGFGLLFFIKKVIIECIFLSQGRHYDSFPDFTPSSDASWCLTDWFSALRNSSQDLGVYFEIRIKIWFTKLFQIQVFLHVQANLPETSPFFNKYQKILSIFFIANICLFFGRIVDILTFIQDWLTFSSVYSTWNV